MEKIKIFKFPAMANYYITVIVTDSILESRNKRSKKIGNLYQGTTGIGLCSTNKQRPESFIFLYPDTDIDTIAHESCHAVDNMLDFIGSEKDREVYAYHVGYIAGQTNHFIKNNKKRK